MAKVQIKFDSITSFGGIFPIMEQFDALLSNVIDSTLGLRSRTFGYQYSEILRSLMCVFFCGGSCIEDVSTHLMRHLSSHPRISTCSADTILRAIKELTVSNITYTSPVSGKSYDFNTSDKMNELLVKSLISTGELRKGQKDDLDFDHQFIATEKYDAKPTYKKFTGYSPGIAVIGDHIVGIENRDGNANVRFHQQDTLERVFTRLENNGILTNDFDSDVREIVEFYNMRGGKERIFDDMNNGFGWKRLPKSFMAENTVYLLMTVIIRNFYKTIIKRMNVKEFGLSTTSRIKTFVFKFISVPAKWIKTSGEYRLNIYTVNPAYARVFNASD